MLFLVGAFIIFSVLTRNVILCYNRRGGGLSAVSRDYLLWKMRQAEKACRSMVRLMRFERTTFRVGVWHSIQLSYGRVSWIDLYIITERSQKVKRGKGRNWRTKNRCKKGRKGRKVRFFKKSQKKGKKGVDKRKLAWYYNWAVWERHTRAVR